MSNKSISEKLAGELSKAGELGLSKKEIAFVKDYALASNAFQEELALKVKQIPGSDEVLSKLGNAAEEYYILGDRLSKTKENSEEYQKISLERERAWDTLIAAEKEKTGLEIQVFRKAESNPEKYKDLIGAARRKEGLEVGMGVRDLRNLESKLGSVETNSILGQINGRLFEVIPNMEEIAGEQFEKSKPSLNQRIEKYIADVSATKSEAGFLREFIPVSLDYSDKFKAEIEKDPRAKQAYLDLRNEPVSSDKFKGANRFITDTEISLKDAIRSTPEKYPELAAAREKMVNIASKYELKNTVENSLKGKLFKFEMHNQDHALSGVSDNLSLAINSQKLAMPEPEQSAPVPAPEPEQSAPVPAPEPVQAVPALAPANPEGFNSEKSQLNGHLVLLKRGIDSERYGGAITYAQQILAENDLLDIKQDEYGFMDGKDTANALNAIQKQAADLGADIIVDPANKIRGYDQTWDLLKAMKETGGGKGVTQEVVDRYNEIRGDKEQSLKSTASLPIEALDRLSNANTLGGGSLRATNIESAISVSNDIAIT